MFSEYCPSENWLFCVSSWQYSRFSCPEEMDQVNHQPDHASTKLYLPLVSFPKCWTYLQFEIFTFFLLWVYFDNSFTSNFMSSKLYLNFHIFINNSVKSISWIYQILSKQCNLEIVINMQLKWKVNRRS